MSLSQFDLDIERERTSQVEAISEAIKVFAREFSKAGVHDNVKARAVDLIEKLFDEIKTARRKDLPF